MAVNMKILHRFTQYATVFAQNRAQILHYIVYENQINQYPPISILVHFPLISYL